MSAAQLLLEGQVAHVGTYGHSSACSVCDTLFLLHASRGSRAATMSHVCVHAAYGRRVRLRLSLVRDSSGFQDWSADATGEIATLHFARAGGAHVTVRRGGGSLAAAGALGIYVCAVAWAG